MKVSLHKNFQIYGMQIYMYKYTHTSLSSYTCDHTFISIFSSYNVLRSLLASTTMLELNYKMRGSMGLQTKRFIQLHYSIPRSR